ncbi:MAG: 50S ribosomal protein L18 [Patescibacteria group bacterium]
MKNREQRIKRHKRVRARIIGADQRPRLSVFRSARHIYAQVIDDVKGETMTQFNDSLLNPKENKKTVKSERAKLVGKYLGKILAEKGIKKIVFDRGGYKYHGRVKALAEGLRETGIRF